MAAVLFADGTRIAAPTWGGVERKMRSITWNPSGRRAFRREMALRAKNWSGTMVDKRETSKAFFARLEEAGLLRIEEE